MAVAPCVKTDGRVRTARGARRPLRWSLACLIAAALGAVAAGCGATAPLAIDMNAQWATRIVDDHQVSLSVPANWNIGEAWVQPSSFDNLAGSFSNQSLSSPCSSGPSTLACGPPIASLQPGAVLVEVFQNGFPGWTLDSQTGTSTTVSGLPAKLAVETGAHDYCAGLGGDRTRSLLVAYPGAVGNYFDIEICSRGVPDSVGARIDESVHITPLS